MKKSYGRKFTLILSLVLLISFVVNPSEAKALAAATPTFTESTFEIVGEGVAHQLEIKDKVSGSTYKWSSSNTKVAKVSSKGLVTSVGKGSATIKCVITYPTSKTKTISSKVKVIVPASEVRINNAVEVNGAHIMLLGEKFNFNRDIVPAGSSDITFWSIGGGDADCIRIDDSSSGIVTALKTGKVILKATAAKSTSSADIKSSIVNDAIIIEVKSPTATVNNVEITGSTEIKAVFDSPIEASTVIGANNTLLDSIEVTLRKNIKGVLAKDPGKLKAGLSADGRTLTITSENMFDGEYGINFTPKIKTTGGVAIEEYYKQISYVDTTGPVITAIVLDDSGLISTIQFNEAIDISTLKVSNATLYSGSATGAADPVTISTLNNRLNYVLSTDKKSLTINMSKIASTDYGKTFSVTFSGIKDLSGNAPDSFTLTAFLRTDITPKPQARPMTITRTSYNVLTVTFDRAIQSPGYLSVNSGSMVTGVVDATDNKKVNYTITDYDASLTGYQTVYLIYWNGYNVSSSDTSANQQYRFSNVDFTADKTSPVLLSYEFDAETNILTLTYNENVVVTSNSGIFTSSLVTITDEIYSGTNLTYTKMESSDPKIVKLLIGNMTLIGTYTFMLEHAFVMDNFRNFGLGRSVTISNSGGSAMELPGPYAIIQSTTNPSQIYLEFANMLDVASATNIANYNIPGVTILSADVTKNTKLNGATVVLTVADGSIDVTLERPITIKGIRGFNGGYSEIIEFKKLVELKDNKKPYMTEQPTYDKVSLNVIKMSFSEAIIGTIKVKVTQIGTFPVELPASVTISGNSVIITLGSMPINGSVVRLDLSENHLTDVSGNQVSAMASQYSVYVAY